MKVLVLVNGAKCAHDYGSAYIIDGLRTVCGADNVFDFPQPPCLHLKPGEPRDGCNIDSDAWWPMKSLNTLSDVLAGVDVVLIGFGPGVDAMSAYTAGNICNKALPTVPVGVLDMSDQVVDLRGWYAQFLKRPFVYFKRELPLGANWGHPCPLTYPSWKAWEYLGSKEWADKTNKLTVFYHATDHGGGPPGVPRRQIVDALRRMAQPPSLDVMLTPSQENRLSPEAYHERMASALIGIAWNGAPNWDNNRAWENFAFGLCQVMERPRIQIPHPPVHLEHACLVDSPAEVAPMVRMLLSEGTALDVAQEGHAWFLAHHAADRRAQYILDTIGAAGA